MPIYEYLCPACNRIFSFLVRSLGEKKEPTCPRCGGTQMERQISRFAVTGTARKSKPEGGGGKRGGETGAGDWGGGEGAWDREGPGGDWGGGEADREGEGRRGPDPLDDPRIERELFRLMSEAESLDENDPRQLGRFMRRMAEITGEPVEGEMEEALRRLEAGEDPEKVEEDMGDVFGGGEGEEGGPGGPPTYDDGLYPL